jgi:hypothetical protein
MSQPFDRCLMGFAVYRRRLQPQAAQAGNGHYKRGIKKARYLATSGFEQKYLTA